MNILPILIGVGVLFVAFMAVVIIIMVKKGGPTTGGPDMGHGPKAGDITDIQNN